MVQSDKVVNNGSVATQPGIQIALVHFSKYFRRWSCGMVFEFSFDNNISKRFVNNFQNSTLQIELRT